MIYEKREQALILEVRKMFVIALTGGVLSVCLPQFFNMPLLAVLLPLLCMIIYTWAGYIYSDDSPFMEQFADSVYYLGFLLTLVALVVSLYFYQSDTLETGLLTANFSLALITTIFGLAVRIFINNFQVDLGSVERQMMMEVGHAANEMIRKAKLISMQLDVSHQETQSAIKKSVDAAAEGMQQTALTIDRYAQTRSDELLQNTQRINQRVENIVKTFEQNMQNIKLPDEVFSDKLNPPIELLIQRLDDTQMLLKNLNEGQGEISQSTQEIIASMVRSVREIEMFSQSISVFNDRLYANTQVNDDFSRVVKEIASLSEKTTNISKNLQQQTEQSTVAMQNFTKMVNSVNALPADIETLSSRLKQSSEQVSATFQAIGNETEAGMKIGNDLQEIAVSLANTKETVKQISDFGMHVTSTFKRLENFNQLMEQHTQLMADMGGVAQIDIDLAKDHQREMAAILKQSRKSLAQMQQDTVAGKNNSNNRTQG